MDSVDTFRNVSRWLPQIIDSSQHKNGYNLVQFADIVLRSNVVDESSYTLSTDRPHRISHYFLRSDVIFKIIDIIE